MHRFYSILLLLFCASYLAQGQEFKLLEIKEFSNDSLLLSNTCYDINGQISAIVLLSFTDPIKNLTFRGNVLESKSDDDNSYVLYVPNRTRRITLLHDDYYSFVLDFKEKEV